MLSLDQGSCSPDPVRKEVSPIAEVLSNIELVRLILSNLQQEDSPAEDSSAEDSPAEDSSAEDSPAEDSSAEDSPAEDSSAEDSPAEDSSAEAPAEDSPVICPQNFLKLLFTYYLRGTLSRDDLGNSSVLISMDKLREGATCTYRFNITSFNLATEPPAASFTAVHHQILLKLFNEQNKMLLREPVINSRDACAISLEPTCEVPRPWAMLPEEIAFYDEMFRFWEATREVVNSSLSSLRSRGAIACVYVSLSSFLFGLVATIPVLTSQAWGIGTCLQVIGSGLAVPALFFGCEVVYLSRYLCVACRGQGSARDNLDEALGALYDSQFRPWSEPSLPLRQRCEVLRKKKQRN